MKKIIVALGLTVAFQPAPAIAMDSVKDIATNKWTHVAGALGATAVAYMKPNFTTLALAASAVGFTVQKHGGDLLADYKGTRTDKNQGKTLGKDDHLYNKKMNDFVDNVTNYSLAFAADLMVPRVGGKVEKEYILPMHLLTGTFNAYRATKTLCEEGTTWYKNLDETEVAKTSLYVLLGAATGGLGYIINKDSQVQLATLRFVTRGFQDQFCTWISNDKNHKVNQAIADLAAFLTGAYYRV